MSSAVIYTRVSTDEQAKLGLSLESQEKACREFAARNSFEVLDVFREEGASAKTADRKQLLNLLNYCKTNKGKVNALIVWKVDRFARRTEDHLTLKTYLAKFGVQLLSVTEPIEDSNIGRLMETMLAAFAQFDNELRAERSKTGAHERIEQGGWPFYAPIGYVNYRDSLNRPTLSIDPVKAPLIEQIFVAYSSGNFTLRGITEHAYTIGLTSRKQKKLAVQTVTNILKNPAYTGQVISPSAGKLIPAIHKPIISKDLFHEVQQVMAGKGKDYRVQKDEEWPLRGGFLRCSFCNSPITGSKPKGRNKIYPKYNCAYCRASITKKPVSISRDKLHEDFLELLEKVKPDEKLMTLFKTVVIRRWNEEYKEVNIRKEQISKELSGLNSRRERILDLFIDGKLSDTEKEEQIVKLDGERTYLQIQESELKNESLDHEQVINIASDFMINVSKYWKSAPLQLKRRFQYLVFPEGIQYEFGEGFRTAKLGPAFEVVRTSNAKSVQSGTRGRI